MKVPLPYIGEALFKFPEVHTVKAFNACFTFC
jgi:hypothetical protein